MSDFRVVGTPVIRADFNSASQAGVLFASSRFLESAFDVLGVGTEIVVRDDEGNSCRGVVTDIEGMAVRIELGWSTWQSDDSPSLIIEAHTAVYEAPSDRITTTLNDLVAAGVAA